MDWMTSFVQFVASPLMPAMEVLIAALAGSEHRSANDIDSMVAAFALSTGLIGLICVLSTCWIHTRLRKQRRRAAMDIAVADAALYFREALLEAAARGVMVLRDDDQGGEYFGDGKMLHEGCMASPHSAKLTREINALVEDDTPFSIAVESSEGGLSVRGRSVAGRAVVYFEDSSAMQLALDAQDDVLDHSTLAVAVFDRDQKLTSCNRAYAELWGLPRPWLQTRSYGEILERLRDERKLPEQRNFPDWKQAHIQAISVLKERLEEDWHLPSGKSVRLTAWPHLQGGFFVQVEDLTERLHWQAEFNLLAQVQRATLDTLSDGIAIFGTDGRLVLHNDRFANMWKLSDSDLAGRPHFAEIADLCTTKLGRDGIWGIVSCGINSSAPESFGEWGKTKRADGRVISLALSRLPNGSTVVNFVDLTDLERFDDLKNDRSYAIA